MKDQCIKEILQAQKYMNIAQIGSKPSVPRQPVFQESDLFHALLADNQIFLQDEIQSSSDNEDQSLYMSSANYKDCDNILIPDFFRLARKFYSLRSKNVDQKVKKIEQIMNYIVKRMIDGCYCYRKFIHEKIQALINYSTFTKSLKQNPQILMNTSRRNSSNLKSIMQTYYIENRTQRNIRSLALTKKNLFFQIESVQQQPTKRSNSQWKKKQLNQLINAFNYLRQILKEVIDVSQQTFQNISSNKMMSLVSLLQLVDDHIQKLILTSRSNEEEKNSVSQSFNDALYQKFLVSSLKYCLEKAFETERPFSKKLSLSSDLERKKLYYSHFIAESSNIPQFEEVTFDRRQQNIDFCYPSSFPFIEKEKYSNVTNVTISQRRFTSRSHRPHLTRNDQNCRYFIELMNFLKGTITQGITIQLTKSNLLVCNQRMKFALQQPLHIVKDQKELQAINPQLSNMMRKIQEQQPNAVELDIFSKAEDRQKQLSRHIETHVNNLTFALTVLQIIIKELSSGTKGTLMREKFDLDCNYQQFTSIMLRTVYDDLLKTFKSIKDPPQENNEKETSDPKMIYRQFFQVDTEEKDAFKLMEAIMIMKITITTYKFYQLIDKNMNYRKYQVINKQITSRSDPLSTIYTNLFQQNYRPSISEFKNKYNRILIKLLDLITSTEPNFTGIHKIREYNKMEFEVFTQFTTQFLHQQKTVVFSGLPRELARELLIKVCLPVQNRKSLENKKKGRLIKEQQEKIRNQEEQNIEFSSIQAQQVIKILLHKIKIAFDKATKKGIKVPLFLLRHFTIESKKTKSNIPYPIPGLNILQAFLDTNILNNIYNPNFVEQHYLNLAITKLSSKLTTKSHNQLIQSIFLLSLITEKTESQYLKSVHFYIMRKIQAANSAKRKVQSSQQSEKQQSKIVPLYDIAQLYNQIIPTLSRNNAFWYLQQMNVKSFFNLLKKNVIQWPDKRHHYQENQQILLNLSQSIILNQPFDQQRGQLPQQRCQTILHFNFDIQRVHFVRKRYKIPQVSHRLRSPQLERVTIIRQLLLLQLQNMKYLCHSRHKPESSLIKNIIAVLPKYSNEGRMISYQVTILTEDRVLQPKNRYPLYFGSRQYENFIIQRKSDFYYSLTEKERMFFILELLRIIKQAKHKKINLFNIDISTITIVPTQQLHQLRRRRFIRYEKEAERFTQQDFEKIHIRPIIDEISVCRVYHPQLIRQNNRVYQLYGQYCRTFPHSYLSFKHHLNVFTSPDYFQRPKPQETSENGENEDNGEDIGNIGLIICSLIFNYENYYRYLQQQNNYQLQLANLQGYWVDPQDQCGQNFISEFIKETFKQKDQNMDFLRSYADLIDRPQSLNHNTYVILQQIKRFYRPIPQKIKVFLIQEVMIKFGLRDRLDTYVRKQRINAEQMAQKLTQFLEIVVLNHPRRQSRLTSSQRNFLPFLLKMVHPRFEKRANILDVMNELNMRSLV